ncbi:MAG TPA: class I SAM-dependent methyltransferase [Candidatus Acidoferrum sp.]|nr:class I SAM-dependent methyltransferase [Candidatus Acidoferrum sp.]
MSATAQMKAMTAIDDASPSHRGWRARVFAFLLPKVNAKYERLMAARKRSLLGDLRGKVLEIGPGAGVNLSHYDPGVQWIGIEPNPFMQAYLRKEAKRCGLQVDLRTGNAERLDAPDQSVDAVVCTLVLCSVCDPKEVLKEVRRVLKPGARFVFIEHVAAPRGTWLRSLQNWFRPFLVHFAVGCHPNRETWTAIESAGFSKITLHHFRAPTLLPILSPHVAGVAIR